MNIDKSDILITSKYGSHLPILGTIFSNCEIKNVFEFGCGLFSTFFFLKYANKVESVEMQNESWYETVSNKFKNEKLNISLMLGETKGIQYFNSLNERFDIVFVDGINREECVNSAFNKTDIIVRHDCSHRYMRTGFKNIRLPNKWKYVHITKYNKPFTCVLTNKNDLINVLEKL